MHIVADENIPLLDGFLHIGANNDAAWAPDQPP